MTHFKICGLRDAANALVAAECGADLLGFVFVEGVRRQLTPDEGRRVIAKYRRSLRPVPAESLRSDRPRIVGLFANQPVEFVSAVARLCDLDYAQLCGDEPPQTWAQLDVPVIRQVKVREDLPRDVSLDIARRQVAEALDAGHHAVLDKYQAGHLGGTGATFDWSLARDIAGDHRVLLAGGLTPDNVGEAIGMVRPWAVDVSSGVETGGVKDPVKIRAFAAAVNVAEQPRTEP